MSHTARLARPPVAILLLAALACDRSATEPATTGAVGAPAESPAEGLSLDVAHGPGSSLMANGSYHFTIPADFNGGIFGLEIGNHVSFTAKRAEDGTVTGRFRYVQSGGGESFVFSGTVTCLAVHDTPVLARYPEIPAGTANRAKWGGVIEASNDATIPLGRFIWFQSIDNDSGPHTDAPDLSTLSGFGDAAANEAFCASPNVPNPNFGPHPVNAGQVVVH